MAPAATREYLDLLARWQEATARIERMVNLIQQVGRHLENWRSGFAWQMGQLSIREEDWPTLGTLRTEMLQWHHLRRKLRNAWRRVPAADKSGLRPPE